MATTPSQTPVASELPQDLKYNAGKIDEFVTSLALQYIDRFGSAHYTIEGIKQLAFDAMSNFGYVTISSFEDGATLTNPNQALLWESNGEYYKWTGNLPKEVPAASTPDSTGGIGPGAWLSIGDSLLRSMLASSTGAQLIGTNHRGTLQADLDRIDRRPDGYASGIEGALATGFDVEVGTNLTRTTAIPLSTDQVYEGRGGIVTIPGSTGIQAIAADARASAGNVSNADSISIRSLKAGGAVLATGTPAYAIWVRDSNYPTLNGTDSSGFTGSVSVSNSHGSFILNTRAKGTVYHPDRAAGGYAVLLDETRDAIINGVFFEAGAGNDGRHMLYVSRSGSNGNTYDGCINTIATHMIARYTDKDDRNMHLMNIRKSDRNIISTFIGDGSNSGISVFTENGNVLNSLITNAIVYVKKYQDGLLVYGFQSGVNSGYMLKGSRISNLIIEVQPKPGAGLSYGDCIGFSAAVQNCMFDGIITKIGSGGRPFYLGACTDITISNVLDYVDDADTGGKQTLFTFLAATSGLKLSNIKSPRSFFSLSSLQQYVTDMTVDWSRKVKVSVAAGVATISSDVWGLVSGVTMTSSSVVVAFHPHVTQAACDTARVQSNSAHQYVVTANASKTFTLSVYTIAGAGVPPNTGTYAFEVILSQ
jgi:hypothetical protein